MTVHIVPHFTVDLGTQPKVFSTEGELILDATVSPIQIKRGLNLYVHADDPRQIRFFDKNGVPYVWTEGGETFVDETADVEFFGDEE